MKAYFAMNTPYLNRINDKITNLLKLVSVAEIMAMIEELDEVNRIKWKVAFYEELLEEEISAGIVAEMIDFISEQLEFENMQIPNIYSLSKYKNKGIDIVEQITGILLEVGRKKPYIVVNFFDRNFDDEKIDILIDFFEEDTDKLLKLYLISMESDHFDYDGNLLLRLIQINMGYWNEITMKCGEAREGNINSSIFDKIWMMDNYCELVDIAYANVQDSYFRYLRHGTISNMFAASKNNKSLIMKRKESWIRKHIDNHVHDEVKIKNIFDVITTVFPGKRLEYMKWFLEKNSNFNMFSKISLFPKARFWSGSEVPLIEEDIKFLQKLANEISGVDYLEHKLYLKKLIRDKKQYKQKILKREYMENFEYN